MDDACSDRLDFVYKECEKCITVSDGKNRGDRCWWTDNVVNGVEEYFWVAFAGGD